MVVCRFAVRPSEKIYRIRVNLVLERIMPLLQSKVLTAHFREDICFNTGPMISPDYFKNHVVPRYKQITDVLLNYDIDRRRRYSP